MATVGGFMEVRLIMDDDNMAAQADVYSIPTTATFRFPAFVSFAWYLPTDGVFAVRVNNYDGGAGPNDFYISYLNIQKLS
jgi:hypothetical protein